MESIAISVATTVAEIAAEGLVARIRRQLGYLLNYRSNILDLTQQLQKLRYAEERLQQSVDEANRQGDEIFADVKGWLSWVEGVIQETDKIIEDEKAVNRSCFNLKLRYQKSKKAKNQAGDIVTKIQEANNFGSVAHRPPPPGIGSSSLSGSQVFKSRETTLNQIMEALRDDGIMMIGVWGMAGVGKTTFVQQLAKLAEGAKQANEEKLFDKVVMSLNISQTPNVTKIQGEIASMLGLIFEEADESGRAVRLSRSLKKHKKILVILDDIWEAIEFETIGIPYGSDDHKVGYCKVLLTSRENHVLSKDMGTHKDFELKHLCEEEAWSLFNKTADVSLDKTLELRFIATEVVKKCEGLPVAIVTVGKALKKEGVAVWRNALEELRRSAPTNIGGMSENVYSCLELSYNHLESDEVKSLFLLCSLLGDGDVSLDDLLKYGMGLDLFDNIDSLEKARNNLVTLVEILKASSLLLDVLEVGDYLVAPSLLFAEESSGFVRMHDVVRDVAKAIASKDPHRFVVKEALGLQGWQKRDHELENCTRISLNCRDDHDLPEGLVCPKLGFFLLNGNYSSLKNPDSFFKEMKEVRVLSLLRIDLKQMPSSLLFLSNLRTLCLRGCGMLKDITILGELKKLQVLSLVYCKILEFPKEMMHLTDLRMLNLRDCGRILVPRNVISSLSRLEHLCMRNRFNQRESEEAIRGRNAWLSELKHLSCLRTLELLIPSSRFFPEDVSFENLTRYYIFIGCLPGSYDDKKSSRRLTLNQVESPHVHLVKCFSKLLKTTEVLELRRLDDTKHFVYELDRQGFLQLKYLYIGESKGMQYIMNTMEMEWVHPPHSAFPLLEELQLIKLDNLEVVLCHGPIPMGCFANLRVLIIEDCYRLIHILWVPTAQGRESVLVFPQLRSLKLTFLPDLIEFYSTGTSGSQEPFIPFFNQQVALPKLESLYLSSMDNVRTMWHNQHPVGSCCKVKKLDLFNCKNLLTVFPSNFLKGLQSLESLQIDDCCSLKEIFEVGEINSVRNKDPQGYLALQNLNSLEVGGCTCLKYLFPVSVVKCLVQLEALKISNCGVEEIVANENGLQAMPIFLFPRLTSLKLSKLHQLQRFYGDMYTLGCPLLKTLKVRNCDKVELLVQEKSLQGEVDKQPLFLVEKNTFPNVEELKLGLKGPMEIWWSQFSRESFGKLRVLEIKECHDISVAIPSSKLQVLHNLEQLTVGRCNSVKELIQVEGLEGETLPQLTKIYLEDLPMLTHLCVQPILQNLHSLRVYKCGNLINLVSPSMAKTLVQLKELNVGGCDEVKEIVENEGGEATDDEIVFTKLQTLKLSNLPNLKSFCSARYTFRFPCLGEMWVRGCPEMEFFCKGDSITQSLKGIYMEHDRQHWEKDLNTTIQKQFMETMLRKGTLKSNIPR